MSGSDVVTSRALAPQPVVLEYAAPLLRLGGTLVDWRGRRDPPGERAAERAAAVLGLRRVNVREVRPFARATDRHLHVFEKVSETPARFPRRTGVARKRPLGD
jgi:16S rRNA (guanine527-N7)-methyltransferase